MAATPRVRLFEDDVRSSHTAVHAEIDPDGNLLVSEVGVGITPEGDSMPELGLLVEEPDRVLLLLLKERFGGEATVLNDLEAWLEDNGVAFRREAAEG